MLRAWKVLPVFVLMAASGTHADPDRLPQRNPEPAKPAAVKTAPVVVKTTNTPAPAKTAAPAAARTVGPAPKTATVAPLSAPKPPPALAPRCLKLSGVERMVCADAGLARLDAQMNALYRKALADAADPGGLKATHQDWIELERDRCGNVTCLRAAYQSQIAELRAFTSP